MYRVALWFLCSAHPCTAIYLLTKFHFNAVGFFKDIAQTGIHYKTKWKSEDNSVNIKGRIMVFCARHFLSLPSIYIPSFISIPFLLNKIWAGQASTMKTWLCGDNSVNVQGSIMVLVHCISSYSNLSINQFPFQSL